MNCEKCGNPLVEENGIMVCKNCSANTNNTDEVVVSETPVVEVAQTPVVEVPSETNIEQAVSTESTPEVVVSDVNNEASAEVTPVVDIPEVSVPMDNANVAVASEPVAEVNLEVEAPSVAPAADNAVVDSTVTTDVTAITNEVSASIDNANVDVTPQTEVPLVENGVSTADLPPEKKGGKKGLIIGIVIALVLIAAVVGVGFFFYGKATDSKAIVNGVITKVLTSYKNTTSEVTKPSKVSFDYFAKVVTDEKDSVIAKIISNLAVSGDTSIDINNKVANVNLNFKYADAPMLNASMYFQDNKAYLGLNELFDKYMDLGITEDEINEMFEVDKKADGSVYKVIDTALKTINNSIKEEEYTQEVVDYTLNGDNTKAVKHVLKINKERYVKLMLDVLNAFNNEEGIKALDELDVYGVHAYDDLDYGVLPDETAVATTEDKLKEEIDFYTNYDYEKENHNTIDVEFYTGLISGDFLKLSFKSTVSEYDSWEEKRFNEVTTMNFSKTTDSTWTYDLKIEDEEYEEVTEYSGNFKFDEVSKTFVFDVRFDLESSSTNTTTADETEDTALITISGGQNKLDFKVYIESDGESFEITLGFKVEDLEKLDKKDVKDTVLMAELSEADQLKIEQGLEGNVAFKAFSEDVTLFVSELLGGLTGGLDDLTITN